MCVYIYIYIHTYIHIYIYIYIYIYIHLFISRLLVCVWKLFAFFRGAGLVLFILAIFYPPSEIDLGLFWPGFTGSEGK